MREDLSLKYANLPRAKSAAFITRCPRIALGLGKKLSAFVTNYAIIGDKYGGHMSQINELLKHLDTIPSGKPFTADDFRHVASYDNIKQALSRLVKMEKIRRLSRGIYVKPEKDSILGELPTSATEIAKKLTASTGETITVHGAEAARILRLSTQVPIQKVFYTNGNSRVLKIGNQRITLKHINPSRLIAPGTKVGLAISALIYLGKENITQEKIQKIKKQLSKNEFNAIFKKASALPAWLANTLFKYKNGEENNE